MCDIWKMKSVLLLVLGLFSLAAAQTPERCGAYSDYYSMDLPSYLIINYIIPNAESPSSWHARISRVRVSTVPRARAVL